MAAIDHRPFNSKSMIQTFITIIIIIIIIIMIIISVTMFIICTKKLVYIAHVHTHIYIYTLCISLHHGHIMVTLFTHCVFGVRVCVRFQGWLAQSSLLDRVWAARGVPCSCAGDVCLCLGNGNAFFVRGFKHSFPHLVLKEQTSLLMLHT